MENLGNASALFAKKSFLNLLRNDRGVLKTISIILLKAMSSFFVILNSKGIAGKMWKSPKEGKSEITSYRLGYILHCFTKNIPGMVHTLHSRNGLLI